MCNIKLTKNKISLVELLISGTINIYLLGILRSDDDI